MKPARTGPAFSFGTVSLAERKAEIAHVQQAQIEQYHREQLEKMRLEMAAHPPHTRRKTRGVR